MCTKDANGSDPRTYAYLVIGSGTGFVILGGNDLAVNFVRAEFLLFIFYYLLPLSLLVSSHHLFILEWSIFYMIQMAFDCLVPLSLSHSLLSVPT